MAAYEEAIHLITRVRVSLRLKHKRAGIKRPLVEMRSGAAASQIHPPFVSKDQVIDRENDRYRERVVTEDGEVIRDVDEPLSKHQGRGSAKFKRR
jgi:hypothetical protein